jgi:hypothetical protein
MDKAVALTEDTPLYSQERFWNGLLIIAIVLTVFAIFSSELGLDAHVKGAYVESENGWVLDWGDVRTEDPLASNPADAKAVPVDSVTPGTVMLFAILGLMLAIITARKMGFGKETIAVLLLNPALIFSIGRGYSEYTYLAFLGIAWVIWKGSRNYSLEKSPLARITAIGMSSMMIMAILVLKLKVEPFSMFLPFLVLTGIGVWIDRAPDHWFNPQKTMVVGFGFGILTIIILGLNGFGSFSVVSTESNRFIQALPISIFGVIIVYGFVGMVLWPFAKTTWCNMAKDGNRLTGELALFIGTMAGAIVAYVACLWTYESILWNSDWPWHMWTMGNNGRYITILTIPCYVLIRRVNGNVDWKQRKAVAGILLILPISFAAGIHGQTYWTDDAAEVLDQNMQTGEEFLFVHESTLGMHYLYTFHTYIEDVEERDITGHWRDPGSGWENELISDETWEKRGSLTSVAWVVFSPGIGWEEQPVGWYLANNGQADFMNGGGEWEVWTTHNQFSVI